MKDVTIKIVGKHVHDNVDEEQMELITEAQQDSDLLRTVLSCPEAMIMVPAVK